MCEDGDTILRSEHVRCLQILIKEIERLANDNERLKTRNEELKTEHHKAGAFRRRDKKVGLGNAEK